MPICLEISSGLLVVTAAYNLPGNILSDYSSSHQDLSEKETYLQVIVVQVLIWLFEDPAHTK